MSLIARPPENRMYAVTKPPGICLVINICHYDAQTGLKERFGSEHDIESISKVFGDTLHFDVRVREDLTGEEIRQCLQDLVANYQEAMESHGMLLCFIMAHGSNEKVIGRDGVSQNMAELTRLVDSQNCPALVNKPKVFIVHASREPLTTRRTPGEIGEPSTGENVAEEDEPGGGSLSFTNFNLRDADFLVCFANTEGSPVLDNPHTGSAFLQAVCSLVEQEYQQDHFDDILTDVNRYLKSRPMLHNGRRYYYVPEKISSFTRKCFVDPDMALE